MDVVKLTELILRSLTDLSYVMLAAYIARLVARLFSHRLEVLGRDADLLVRREPTPETWTTTTTITEAEPSKTPEQDV